MSSLPSYTSTRESHNSFADLHVRKPMAISGPKPMVKYEKARSSSSIISRSSSVYRSLGFLTLTFGSVGLSIMISLGPLTMLRHNL
ncbi:hypothetical protein Hanom_Chr00s009781g01743641 [Helianthus anomalus]